MSEIRTSGPLLFTEPNNPTRVGEIINTLNEIYDIPMPRLGMSVYVKDEGVNYTITKLEPKLIEGVLVPDAKVAGCELQTGKSIAWNSSSNVNDYVVAGVYNITGERLNVNDGLPIANSNPGHTISARLVVLDSSIKGTGDSQDKCITQVLTLSNRTGEDGNMYIRTGYGGNINSLSWKPWATLQTNTNVGQVDDLDNLKDNGIYSGVWTKGSYAAYPLTFVCIVINDYFVAAPRRISQFVYGLSKFDGSTVYQSRVWDDSNNAWGDWEILNQKEISSMISMEIGKLVDKAPENLDTLKELAEWIESHGTEAAEMLAAINANAKNLAETKKDIANQLIAIPTANSVGVTGRNEQSMRINFSADIPAATTEKAGVMSAEDKKKLNASASADDFEFYAEKDKVGLEISANSENISYAYIPAATAQAAGVMSAKDKVALDTSTSRALRALFVAAGAEYNDSSVDITKTAPWGETVTHKAGHYYLNGLGDITEEQMMHIYAYKDVIYKLNLGRIAESSSIRTFYPIKAAQVQQALPKISSIAVFNKSTIEIAAWTSSNQLNTIDTINMLWVDSTSLYDIFRGCENLKLVYPINCSNVGLFSNAFINCQSLEYMMLYGLKAPVSFNYSPNIVKKCILYIINNASPTSAITITLHPDAYARLADDTEIVAALEAQPLVTLVSA